MPVIIGALVQFAAKIFGDNVLRWIVIKGAMLFLFTVVLPLVFNNFLADMLQMLFGMVNDNSTGISGINPTFSMSNLAAWFAEKLRLSECIAVIASALILKVTLKQIPFVRF